MALRKLIMVLLNLKRWLEFGASPLTKVAEVILRIPLVIYHIMNMDKNIL